MKHTSINDANYSLQNMDNFKQSLDCISSEILTKYIKLVTEYLIFFFENNKIKTPNNLNFILIRGLETITHVFNTILYYTKNVNITYLHSQKAYYYYIEFMGQILEDNNIFLQLSSKDAVIYVYKKTIYELNNDYKKNMLDLSKDELTKLNYITEHIFLFKTIFSKMLNDVEPANNLIDKFNNLSNKIISTKLDVKSISIMHLFCENLMQINNNNNINFNDFCNICFGFLKKINKKSETNLLQIKDKLVHEDFTNILQNETNEKFLNWVFAN
jgi:hypothetical protein